MLNTLRYRLLFWFITGMLLTAGLIIPASLIHHSREKEITQVTQDVNTLYVEFLKDTKLVNDFLTIEPVNGDFFIKGVSPYLDQHSLNSKGLELTLQSIRDRRQTKAFGIASQLDSLAVSMSHYNILFDSLVYLVYKRGYRNSGLEGELSDYASLIENAPGLTNRDIYELRKVETNYFFNNDTTSVNALRTLVPAISRSISSNSRLSLYEKETTQKLMHSYSEAFMRLVELDRKAGIRKNLALRASLNSASEEIGQRITVLSGNTTKAQKALINRLNAFYLLAVLIIISLAIVFSYRASKHMVSHLEALTNYISTLAKSNPDNPQSIDLQNSALEIKQIYREFRNLLSQLKIWERQRDRALQFADDNQLRYRELADMLPQSVFETDSLGNYTYVNKAWYNSFGYVPKDLTEGLNLIETLTSDSPREDILGEHKIENSSFIAHRKNGTQFPASVYTDNIVRKGKIAGRRGIIIDITDRMDYIRTLQQETSKAKTSDELKSSFLANMSHEIRTPMNSIIGFSNLLASDQIPDTQKKDFTQYIRTSSEVLMNLVDDIIDIAKIEAGELKIVKKDCELIALGRELLTTSLETQKRFSKKHIALNFHPDPNVASVFLKTDPFRLRQIMVNLINNAIKFTDHGSIDFGFMVKDESQIEFYVKDTGPGLSREELDMIFERFKRTRRSEEKNIVGTGLGLAISKNLVQLLGGEMWVDSTAGKGTSFMFTLPYLKPTVLPSEKDPRYKHEAEYKWSGKSILVVEDDYNSFKYLNELLRKTKVEVLHASTGRQAIDLVRENPNLSVVVMDIQLPEMDGLEATKQIKRLNSRLPVIAQTAFAMAGDKEKMKLAGCDDYLPKPLDPAQVMATINHYLIQGVKPLQPHDSASVSHRPGIIAG